MKTFQFGCEKRQNMGKFCHRNRQPQYAPKNIVSQKLAQLGQFKLLTAHQIAIFKDTSIA